MAMRLAKKRIYLQMIPLRIRFPQWNLVRQEGKKDMRHCGLVFGLALFVLLALNLTLLGQSGDPDAIRQELLSQFKLTQITADRSDIVTPGAVVGIHRDGLVMWSVAAPGAASNTYRGGRISQGGAGFGKGLLIASMAPGGLAGGGYPTRKFVPGENCWVTAINVLKDGVQFKLYSDPYEGLRYYANLKFPFPAKNQIPNADQIMAMVDEVLSVVPTQNQAEPAPPAAQAAALPPTAYQPIAPPPAVVLAPSVSLGMSKEQVIAGFGEPTRKAAAGNKELFVYTDAKMKITFVNGVVSNIE